LFARNWLILFFFLFTGSQPGGGLPLGAQKIESSSYGAYGIAKNNKMSDVSIPNLVVKYCLFGKKDLDSYCLKQMLTRY